MWIFLKDSFLSIVDKAEAEGCLVVRARAKGDIERIFPKAVVLANRGTDYQFRAEISRTEVSRAIAAAVKGIDYPNFKGSVKEDARHDAYVGVWRVMDKFGSGGGGRANHPWLPSPLI
jgi:hypothetical protein